MSGFSADWLALREPADRAARSPAVLEACRRCFAGRSAIVVCDLGSGTGAAVPAFGPFLPPRQRWVLVDNDPANLAAAVRLRAGEGIAIETRTADLAREPAPWPTDCDLVTATALFDLGSETWIGALSARMAAARLPLLATLTYDGQQSFSPAHTSDAAMLAAFNRHQRLDKGLGGPAAGPDGARLLAERLAAHGYHVQTGPSPWRLSSPRDARLIAAILEGWAAAATEAGLVPAALASEWLAARLARTDAMTVGHTDLFAVPAAF